MEYTITQIADLAGVTSRTLRYYDSIGLLRPLRQSVSGYRIYGPGEVDRLQQILFYRELEVSLDDIAAILSAPDYNPAAALRNHRIKLSRKLQRLEKVIETLDKTIDANERKINMNDKEKFEGFKESLIAENESRYGTEIRRKYGDHTIDNANHKLRGLTKEQYDRAGQMETEILALLDAAWKKQDETCDDAVRMAALHKEWLSLYWPSYSKEAHAGLCDMYTADPRFASYYDRGTPGKAVFLRNAIHAWLNL